MQDLLLKAFEGNSDAQYQLGIRYCIRSTPRQAYYWLQRAAKQGNSNAVSLLEELRTQKIE
jgi:TPR repeat protein